MTVLANRFTIARLESPAIMKWDLGVSDKGSLLSAGVKAWSNNSLVLGKSLWAKLPEVQAK